MITLPPGTITVDTDPETGRFVVHALTEEAANDLISWPVIDEIIKLENLMQEGKDMLWIAAGMIILILLVLVRAIIGPTVIDRLVSINAITGKASVVILLLAFISKEFGFIGVAVVFMLCGFVSSLWILKALVPKVWNFKVGELDSIIDNGEGDKLND